MIFPRIFYAKIINHQGKFYWSTVVFPYSVFFGLRGGIHTALGVLTGRRVLSVLFGEVRTFPLLLLHICIHCVIFLRDYIFYKFLWYHLNMDCDVFIPVHKFVLIEILYVHEHVSLFDV